MGETQKKKKLIDEHSNIRLWEAFLSYIQQHSCDDDTYRYLDNLQRGMPCKYNS